jgi:hypothetical protein
MKDITSSVEFAASYPEALRKIPELPASAPVQSGRISTKLKRYKVDE